MPTWKIVTFVANAVLKAVDLNSVSDNFTLLDQHKHTGASGDGDNNLTYASSRGHTQHLQLYPFFPSTSTGATYPTNSNYRLYAVGQLNAQNDNTQFPVQLQAGTYTINVLLGSKASGNGIGTLYLDASSLGTVDAYAAATTYNNVSTLSGVTVASTALYTFKIQNSTKNGSSSGYVFNWQVVEFIRTGA